MNEHIFGELDRVSWVRSAATKALGQLGLGSDAWVVDCWLALLGDRDAGVRAEAAKALGRLGLDSDPRVD